MPPTIVARVVTVGVPVSASFHRSSRSRADRGEPKTADCPPGSVQSSLDVALRRRGLWLRGRVVRLDEFAQTDAISPAPMVASTPQRSFLPSNSTRNSTLPLNAASVALAIRSNAGSPTGVGDVDLRVQTVEPAIRGLGCLLLAATSVSSWSDAEASAESTSRSARCFVALLPSWSKLSGRESRIALRGFFVRRASVPSPTNGEMTSVRSRALEWPRSSPSLPSGQNRILSNPSGRLQQHGELSPNSRMASVRPLESDWFGAAMATRASAKRESSGRSARPPATPRDGEPCPTTGQRSDCGSDRAAGTRLSSSWR